MWSVAAVTVSVFGGRHRAMNGTAKICKKFAAKGIAESNPIAGFGNTQACVTSAVRNTFTGSAIVTIGIATRPSWVQSSRLRCRSALRWTEGGADSRGRVAFNVGSGGMKRDAADY